MIDAYRQLSTCRPLGAAGVAPIPVTAIWAFADRHDCPDWFCDVIRAVDVDLIHRHGQPEGKAVPNGRR